MLAVLCCLLLPWQAAAAPRVLGVRMGEHGAQTRMVLDISEKVNYQVFYLPNPNRVVIDLPALDWQARDSMQQQGRGLVSGFRYGLFTATTSRIVIDVAQPAEVFRSMILPPSAAAPSHRLVFDLRKVSAQQFTGLAKTSLATYNPEAQSTPVPQNNQVFTPAQSKKSVIVIDAGHGGVDPGAVGASGTYEKTVTLMMARELKQQLEATGRYKVVLTRDRDIFLKLRQRVDVARHNYADLFISLHADSNPHKSTRGLSVYTLSETASDKEAARLAAKENKADLIAGVDLGNESPEVSNILLDLTQRETMNLSVRFAEGLVATLAKNIKVLSNAHRFAGFVVLKAPDVPSVLVELGYLSNREDEKLLLQKSHQQKVAANMVKSINEFFNWKTEISGL